MQIALRPVVADLTKTDRIMPLTALAQKSTPNGEPRPLITQLTPAVISSGTEVAKVASHPKRSHEAH